METNFDRKNSVVFKRKQLHNFCDSKICLIFLVENLTSILASKKNLVFLFEFSYLSLSGRFYNWIKKN